ncbi:MAG: FtsQ-type POTRA domain-containing protein [Pseudomonadota bacterium]|nr:FtsQ-type POTRA domain-containing protein [Pseudomonadota bacterium]
MARKKEWQSTRQRQSQQIMREKAARKKRQALLAKAAIIGGSALSLALLGGGIWAWKSGAAARAAQAVIDKGYELTGRAGFTVQALYLEGRNRTPMADIEQALGIKKGDPILRLSLSEARERLEKIESVKLAAVERALPGTLYVRIVEREPVALWQCQGSITPVDDQGVAMHDLDIAPYKHLPLIIGDDAPAHVSELLSMLAAEPDLAKRFAAAIHVGERRWNIRLTATGGEIEVKLPESHAGDAWKKLAELQAHQHVLDRDIKMIDLRLEGRMFIRLAPEEIPHKHANAKET